VVVVVPAGLLAELVVECAGAAAVVEARGTAFGPASAVVEVGDRGVTARFGAAASVAGADPVGEDSAEGAAAGVAADDDAVPGDQPPPAHTGGLVQQSGGPEPGDLRRQRGVGVQQRLDRYEDLDLHLSGRGGGLPAQSFDEGVGHDLSAGPGDRFRGYPVFGDRLAQRGVAGDALFHRQ
jgi:hypothetical protein